MAAAKIMIVRHAEKPSDDGKILGVDADGKDNPEELIVRGWQRSGALVRLFAPRDGRFVDPHLATPKTIFASKTEHHEGQSLRPQHTVLELATLLGLELSLGHTKDDIQGLATDAVAATATGPVLIAWEHQNIPPLVNAITKNSLPCPHKWPGDRFDLVWVLDGAGSTGPWSLTQVAQLLLAGDSPKPIPM
jgi:hypothetical protein